MAAGILNEIGLFSEKEMIEPDAIADINFFMGDLNFRFNRTYTEHIPDVQHSPSLIYKFCQLHLVRSVNKVFPEYEENEITFMPTYKREKNSNAYTNKKEQCPSYTDRILVKNNSACPMTIRQYGCREEYWGSDHRPVYSHTSVVSQPQHLINPLTLLDPQTPVQGFGQVKFEYCLIEFDPALLLPIL